MPRIPGARVPHEDNFAQFTSSSKLPPTHVHAFTAPGINAIRQVVVPKAEGAEGEVNSVAGE